MAPRVAFCWLVFSSFPLEKFITLAFVRVVVPVIQMARYDM